MWLLTWLLRDCVNPYQLVLKLKGKWSMIILITIICRWVLRYLVLIHVRRGVVVGVGMGRVGLGGPFGLDIDPWWKDDWVIEWEDVGGCCDGCGFFWRRYYVVCYGVSDVCQCRDYVACWVLYYKLVLPGIMVLFWIVLNCCWFGADGKADWDERGGGILGLWEGVVGFGVGVGVWDDVLLFMMMMIVVVDCGC